MSAESVVFMPNQALRGDVNLVCAQVSKVPTAVLSTTAKAKERAKKKEAEKKKAQGAAATEGTSTAAPAAGMTHQDGAVSEAHHICVPTRCHDMQYFGRMHITCCSYAVHAGSAMEVDGASGDAATSGAATTTGTEKKDEPTSYTISNPSRVVPAQAKFVSLPPNSRCDAHL